MENVSTTPTKAGVVVLYKDGDAWLCLLLRAYRNWDFPKGEIEQAETPLEAARREVHEETSLSDLKFCWGEVFRDTARYGGHKIARYYLAQSVKKDVELPVSPELGRPEHDEFRWTSFDHAKALLAPRLRPIIDWAEATSGSSVRESPPFK